MPWALYDLGKFHLLLDEPYESLDAYAKGLQVSSAPFMIETSLESLDRIEAVGTELTGYEWVRRLLSLGLAARLPPKKAAEHVRPMATPDVGRIEPPVLIVAGGTDPRVQDEIAGYATLLVEALEGFEGTIISGGTREGVSGLVGDVAEAYGDSIRTIGYVPKLIPADANLDKDTRRYSELRRTQGHGFTPLEPLQNWIDLFASRIRPADVRVVGINGGKIAAAEFRIALALGATVGIVAESGREASRLLTDVRWAESEKLVSLPPDGQTVRAFVGPGSCDVKPEECEKMARAIHDEYRRNRIEHSQIHDPAMVGWDDLPEQFKESNREQARHIAQKLEQLGYRVVESASAAGDAVRFTPEEIEFMARMEHGRYTAERLLAGWRWGEKRDSERRTNPSLVGWAELPEDVREIDRQMVRKIPEYLEAVGLTIRRRGETGGGPD